MPDATFPQKNIVILGAGFGGLAAARQLGHAFQRDATLRRTFNIVLVDRNATHTYTPGLYEVATTAREDAAPLVLKRTAAIPITNSIQNLPLRSLQDEVLAVDTKAMSVKLRDNGSVAAEYLVLALGAVTNDFGISGVREHALWLKTFEDALHIRGTVETLLKSKPNAQIVIAGGGATGVELAGELLGLTKRIRGLSHLQTAARITMVEADARLLPGAPEHIAERARKRLVRLGIALNLQSRIIRVDDHEVTFTTTQGTKRLAYDCFVWSGGIKPPPLLEDIVVPKDQKGRCMVDPDLTLHGNDKLFAVGDLTCFGDPQHGKPLPATAYIAIDEGNIAARNILAHIHGGSFSYYYPPSRPPFVVPIGGKWAVAYVAGISFSGFLAFLFRLIVDLNYFRRVLSPIRALRFFLLSCSVYFRND